MTLCPALERDAGRLMLLASGACRSIRRITLRWSSLAPGCGMRLRRSLEIVLCRRVPFGGAVSRAAAGLTSPASAWSTAVPVWHLAAPPQSSGRSYAAREAVSLRPNMCASDSGARTKAVASGTLGGAATTSPLSWWCEQISPKEASSRILGCGNLESTVKFAKTRQPAIRHGACHAILLIANGRGASQRGSNRHAEVTFCPSFWTQILRQNYRDRDRMRETA